MSELVHVVDVVGWRRRREAANLTGANAKVNTVNTSNNNNNRNIFILTKSTAVAQQQVVFFFK